MMKDSTRERILEIVAVILIVGALLAQCEKKAKASIPDKQIIDLDPQSLNTWLSGRFLEYPDPFEWQVILLEQRIEARGEWK